MFKCTKNGKVTETTWYFINGAYVAASTVCELGLNPVFEPEEGSGGFMLHDGNMGIGNGKKHADME